MACKIGGAGEASSAVALSRKSRHDLHPMARPDQLVDEECGQSGVTESKAGFLGMGAGMPDSCGMGNAPSNVCRYLHLVCAIVGGVLLARCLCLPWQAITGLMHDLKIRFSIASFGDMGFVAEQFAGPLGAMLALMASALIVAWRKRLPFLLPALVLGGCYHGFAVASKFSHDWSHVVFHECSNRYARAVAGHYFGVALVAALMLVVEVASRRQGRRRRQEIPTSL